MSEREPEPLDPDLRALLSYERERPAPPPEEIQAVMSRAALTLGGGGGGSAPGGGSGAPPGGGVLPKLPGFSASVAQSLAVGATTLVIGAGVVLGLRAADAPRSSGPARHEMAAAPAASGDPPPSAAVIEPASSPPTPSPDPSPTPIVRPSATATASSAARSHDVEEELALIAEARAAVRMGQRDRALAALDQHARRFPRGQLAAEREVLSRRARAIP